MSSYCAIIIEGLVLLIFGPIVHHMTLWHIISVYEYCVYVVHVGYCACKRVYISAYCIMLFFVLVLGLSHVVWCGEMLKRFGTVLPVSLLQSSSHPQTHNNIQEREKGGGRGWRMGWHTCFNASHFFIAVTHCSEWYSFDKFFIKITVTITSCLTIQNPCIQS